MGARVVTSPKVVEVALSMFASVGGCRTDGEELTMAWKTKSEAAAVLGISTRTLERRITTGELVARRDGRQILVDVQVEDPRDKAAETVGQMAKVGAVQTIQRAKDAELLSLSMANVAKMAEQAEGMARRARRGAVLAWSMTVVLAIAGGVGIWYGTKTVVVAQARADHLVERLDDVRQQAQGLAGELTEARRQIVQAETTAALVAQERDRVQAELGRAKAQANADPSLAWLHPW